MPRFFRKLGIIFLIDESMEAGLADAIETLAPGARMSIELSAAARPGFAGRFREGRCVRIGPPPRCTTTMRTTTTRTMTTGTMTTDTGMSSGTGRGDSHDHEHDRAKMWHAHGDDDHGEHAQEPFDLHIWLDPENAEAMAHMIVRTPCPKPTSPMPTRYEDNAHELIHRIEASDQRKSRRTSRRSVGSRSSCSTTATGTSRTASA